MGNKAIWEYTDEESKKIVDRMKEELELIEGSFTSSEGKFQL